MLFNFGEAKRHLNDWEIQEYEELLSTLEKQNVKKGSDQVFWKLEKRVKFSVQSYYRVLFGGDGENNWVFPFNQIWNSKVPQKVAFFAWEAFSL